MFLYLCDQVDSFDSSQHDSTQPNDDDVNIELVLLI